jgi:hypothetical protein
MKDIKPLTPIQRLVSGDDREHWHTPYAANLDRHRVTSHGAVKLYRRVVERGKGKRRGGIAAWLAMVWDTILARVDHHA